jgi:hypothetical protein
MVGSRQVCVRPACDGFLDCGAGVYPSKTRDLSHLALPLKVIWVYRFAVATRAERSISMFISSPGSMNL